MAAKPSPRGTWFIYRGKGANRKSIGTKISRAQQNRLIRGGITYDDYKRGVSLKAARGHAQTPENPRQAVKHPEKFPKYRNPIRAIVQDGDNATIVEIPGLTKPERRVIARHWNAIFNHLEGKGLYPDEVKSPYKVRSLKSFKGKTYGGYILETREGAIEQLALRRDLKFEDFYPKVK